MNLEEVTAAAMTLSAADKTTLVRILESHLADPSTDEADYDPAYVAEIRRRVEGIRNGTRKTIPAAEVFRKLDAITGREPDRV